MMSCLSSFHQSFIVYSYMTLIYIVVHSRPVVVVVHQSYFFPEIFYICDMQSIYILEYRVLLQCYRACNTISGPWLLTPQSLILYNFL